MSNTKFYKLLNLIQKGDKDNILSYAAQYPELLEIKSSEFSYNTPICITIENKSYDLAMELAKINPDALSESCGGYSDDNAVTNLIIWKENLDLAYQLAKINKATVNSRILYYLIKQTDISDEKIVEFAKLNPKSLDEDANFKGKPIVNAMKDGKTELADKLIEVLDEYQNSQAEHVDL